MENIFKDKIEKIKTMIEEMNEDELYFVKLHNIYKINLFDEFILKYFIYYSLHLLKYLLNKNMDTFAELEVTISKYKEKIIASPSIQELTSWLNSDTKRVDYLEIAIRDNYSEDAFDILSYAQCLEKQQVLLDVKYIILDLLESEHE